MCDKSVFLKQMLLTFTRCCNTHFRHMACRNSFCCSYFHYCFVTNDLNDNDASRCTVVQELLLAIMMISLFFVGFRIFCFSFQNNLTSRKIARKIIQKKKTWRKKKEKMKRNTKYLKLFYNLQHSAVVLHTILILVVIFVVG